MPTPYTIMDGDELAFAAVPASYVLGTNANVAISGSWPMWGDSIPAPAKRVWLYATQDCRVNLYTLNLTLAQAAGKAGAGTPVTLYLVASQEYEIDLDIYTIVATQVGAGGTLYIRAFA